MAENLLQQSPGESLGMQAALDAAIEHQRRWGMGGVAEQLASVAAKTGEFAWNALPPVMGAKWMAEHAGDDPRVVEQQSAAYGAAPVALSLFGTGALGATRNSLGAVGGKPPVPYDALKEELNQLMKSKPPAKGSVTDTAWSDFVASHKLAAKEKGKPSPYFPEKTEKVPLVAPPIKVLKAPYGESYDIVHPETGNLVSPAWSSPTAAKNYWEKVHSDPHFAKKYAEAGKAEEIGVQGKQSWLDDLKNIEKIQGKRAEQAVPPLNPLLPGSPLDRAAQLGYTTDVYHGGKGPWSGKGIMEPGSSAYTEFYTAKHPEVADLYAGTPVEYAKGRKTPGSSKEAENSQFTSGSYVLPLRLKTSNFHEVDAEGATWSEAGGARMRKAISYAKENGHDGVIVRNIYDEPEGGSQYLGHPTDVYIPLKGNVVRSRFANFDPSKIHLNDLLASLGGVAVASGVAHSVVHGDDDKLHSVHRMPEGFDPFTGEKK